MQPEKIGRYKIISELGRGGMAVVYLGYDAETDREVAIKVLLPEFHYKDSQLKARFKREVQIIAKFDLPSIVQLYDVGEENEQPYFVMRYMRGGSLLDKLRDGTYSIEKALKLLEQIAPGIDEAHSKGIVHRDLKPSNILFDGRETPSISDFGIAKIIKTQSSIITNQDQGSPGTPSYMAPEQMLGDNLDGRSDIYALGVILYEMLTGRLPPEAYMLHNLGIPISGPLPGILDKNPEFPSWVETIISKAMARDRRERFSTAGEMVETIKTHLAGNAPTVRKPRRVGRLSLPVTIASFMFILIAGSYFSLKGIFSPKVSPTAAQSTSPIPLIVKSTDTIIPPSQTPTDTSIPLMPSTDTPPAPAVPIAGGSDKIAFLKDNNIWIMNVDGTDLRSLTTDKTEKHNLEWLPDGKTLLYITGKTIKTINIDSKEEEVITSFGASDYFDSFQVSPDGKQVAISLARELHVVPFDLETLKKIATKAELLTLEGCLHYTSVEVEDIRWSNDGKKLAIKFAAATVKNLEDYIRIIDIQFCRDSTPLKLDEFPSARFDFFTDAITSFDWNGENRENGNSLFIMNSDKRNDGFGRLGIYNSSTYLFKEIAPIEGICCYRDAVFSPDGSYVLFAFQDIRLGADSPTVLYNLPVDSLETGNSFLPLPLPDGFFIKKSDSPSPVFRPVK